MPTHLDVEDRPFLGLTVRQVLVLAVGGTWAYAAWALPGGLPVALRLPLAAACVLLAAAGALGWGAWTLAALRYALTPRVAVWRLALAPAVGPRRPRAAPGRDAGEGWVAWRPVPVWATGEHRRCRPGAAPAVAGPGATPARRRRALPRGRDVGVVKTPRAHRRRRPLRLPWAPAPGAPPSVQLRHVGVEDSTGTRCTSRGGRCAACWRSRGRPALPGRTEQEALLAGLAGCLNGLTFPVQVLARVQPDDLAGAAGRLERRLAGSRRPPSRPPAGPTRPSCGASPPTGRCSSGGATWWCPRPAPPGPAALPGPLRLLPAVALPGRRVRRAARPGRRAGRRGRALGGAGGALRPTSPPELARSGLAARRLPGAGVAALLRDWWRAGARAGAGPLADRIAPAAVRVAPDHVRLDRTTSACWPSPATPARSRPAGSRPCWTPASPLEISLHVAAPAQRGDGHGAEPPPRPAPVRPPPGRAPGAPRRPERWRSPTTTSSACGTPSSGATSASSPPASTSSCAPRRATRLDELTRRTEAVLDGMLAPAPASPCSSRRAGLRACAPLGQDALLVYRNLDTSSLATTFPSAAGPARRPRRDRSPRSTAGPEAPRGVF